MVRSALTAHLAVYLKGHHTPKRPNGRPTGEHSSAVSSARIGGFQADFLGLRLAALGRLGARLPFISAWGLGGVFSIRSRTSSSRVLLFGVVGMGTPRKRPVRVKTTPPPPTPPKRNVWDRPPSPAKGDLEINTTYLSVGRALTHWENFEAYLAYIFTETIGVHPSKDLAASRAYGAIMSFTGRAEIIKAASEALFFVTPNSELEAQFEHMMENAVGFSGRRNDLAHGVVGHHPNYSKWIEEGEDPEDGYVLLPAEYATKKRILASGGLLVPVIQSPMYYYSSAEIDRIAIYFRGLRVVAASYLKALHAFLSGSA